MKISFLILLVTLNYITLFAQQKTEVYFDFNKDIPNTESVDYLQKWIKENQTVQINKLIGYCDSIDDDAYNLDLASRRIQSILKILSENKLAINPTIELQPLGKNFKQAKIQAKNRKVEILYEKIIPVKLKPVEEKLSEAVKHSKPGDKIKLKNINFYNNSAIIVPKSKPILNDLLCVMEENPNLKIQMQGHICCQLVSDVNDISTSRARAIYYFLIRNKINKNRLSYKGFGITNPIYPIPEKTEEEEDENRRVEIMIVEI